jgi:endo-beta-N-acetylglucosaminidase D
MTDSLKSLLRPLRNTILSSASPKETPRQTPREREVERNLARIKGFTYLKSMDELLRWDESLEDPIQRSNIPLLPRSSTEEGGKAKTMVVHDFGSAYHEYEANNACIGVEEEAFSLGGGGEMQSIEIFCYFAHYLVSAPPASWVNLCHRNGVKVLGTFIIEPQTPGEEVGRILLERDEDGAFIVVKKLGEIARWIGFEGWIVNIEGVFHDEVWNLDLMTGFLKELRESGIVVWYVEVLHAIIHFANISLPPHTII